MASKDLILLTGLKISCIIGIYDWERKKKQSVVIDLRFPADIRKASRGDQIEDTVNYKKIAKAVITYVEKSRFQLIETLAERLADLLLDQFPIPEIFLRVSKPGAVRGSQNVGVEITRVKSPRPEELVFFSLGSNIEPARHLKNALVRIEKTFNLKTQSHVYETSPVGGKKNQPFFWNMVVGVDTPMKPEPIRQWIEKLEKAEGRVRTGDQNGSRTLDVDLIIWKNKLIKGRGYSLPHPDIGTKAFVLFPLLEISPNLVLSGTNKKVIEIAQAFTDKSQTIRQLTNGLNEL